MAALSPSWGDDGEVAAVVADEEIEGS